MALSKNIATYYAGTWHKQDYPILKAADHATWLGSMVFDAARQFEGVRPDLILNCRRLIYSAQVMGLIPKLTAEEIFTIIIDGCQLFAADAPLYIRPMMWATKSTAGIIDADPNSCAFAICLEELPIPIITDYSLGVSCFRRPTPDAALTTAKAAALYANNARIMAEARGRGFSNLLSLDYNGNVAETASSNVFIVRDGVVVTPVVNGTFLNGLNRQRVIKLLRADGIVVEEISLTVADFQTADEIFCTGNIAKIVAVTRFQKRRMAENPITLRTRKLYWDFAHSQMRL